MRERTKHTHLMYAYIYNIYIYISSHSYHKAAPIHNYIYIYSYRERESQEMSYCNSVKTHMYSQPIDDFVALWTALTVRRDLAGLGFHFGGL